MNKSLNKTEDGFTLIELLVVIAIVAILSIVVLLTLNPAELLRQARDSNRISDMGTLKTAISLYLSDTQIPNLASSSLGFTACYLSTVQGNGTTSAKCGIFAYTGTTGGDASTTQDKYRKVNSQGWVPVDFSKLSIGTPFGSLPLDPSNNQTFFYSYAASSTNVFEVNAILESSKYNNVMLSDGGDNNSTYETGSNLTL